MSSSSKRTPAESAPSPRKRAAAPAAARKRSPSTASTTAAKKKPASKKKPAPKKAAATKKTTAAATTTTRKRVATADVPAGSKELVHVPEDQPAAPDTSVRRGDVDEWGRSERMRSLARAAYAPVYERWHRVEWEGLDKIPTTGGALLVANHSGAIPPDATAIMHGVETELDRPVYGLADYYFRKVPVVGTMWSRLGGLPAHPDNAYRLLRDQQQLVLVFPEGTKGPSKTMGERYRLRRFGRGGFVEIAMRAGVPVIPIAVVGAEESMPIVARLPGVARVMGTPYMPVTANMLLMGPLLGAVAYFPTKFKFRVLDPVRFDVPPDRDRYSRNRVMDESEKIRESIQSALYDMLKDRRSVWFG